MDLVECNNSNNLHKVTNFQFTLLQKPAALRSGLLLFWTDTLFAECRFSPYSGTIFTVILIYVADPQNRKNLVSFPPQNNPRYLKI